MVLRRAYTFGDSYLAEVDIVLPASMSVAESHDIAEELQVSARDLSRHYKQPAAGQRSITC